MGNRAVRGRSGRRHNALLLYGALVSASLLAPACSCRADTIVSPSSSGALSPGVPADIVELADLGIDPDFFLFTGNTAYNYTGSYWLEVIGGGVNPANANSLEGVATQQALLDLTALDLTGLDLTGLDLTGLVLTGPDLTNEASSGTAIGLNTQTLNSTPEPRSIWLCIAGLLTMLGSCKRIP